uniref:C2 domain-containing protein n=4 Tax=Triticinae TaxID=1648030 RepID=A0A453G6P4_AEGTS
MKVVLPFAGHNQVIFEEIMFRQKLFVEVVSANDLSDSLELLSPCVQLRFADQSFTTSVKRKVRCPVWFEKTLFDVLDKERLPSLALEAYVYNVIDGCQFFLGKIRISGASFSDSSDEIVKDYQLKGRMFKRSKGVLLLRVFLKNEAPVSQVIPSPVLGLPVQAPADAVVKYVQPNFEDGMIVGRICYLFVRVVKARCLPDVDVDQKPDPYVEVNAGNLRSITNSVPEEQNPEWNSTFAFSRRQLDNAQITRIYVVVYDGFTDDSVGLISFDLSDIPERSRNDKPVVPKWHQLIDQSGRTAQGELMLSVWKGMQSDEAFCDSWKSDWLEASGVVRPHIVPKVYNLPRLWCLRVHIVEFKCIALACGSKIVESYVTVVVGCQRKTTKRMKKPLAHYVWDEELTFVAAEPFEDDLQISIQAHLGPGRDKVLGRIIIPVQTVQRRVGGLSSAELEHQWHDLQVPPNAAVANGAGDELTVSSCRVHLTTCLDSEYGAHYGSGDHTDEIANPPLVGLLEVGIIGARGLPPIKRKNGRLSSHPYCVARYGRKWVRTRTIINSRDPLFQEQYSWDVYDTATVLIVGVFDNAQVEESSSGGYKGVNIGKIRIHLSDLQPGRIYCHAYPLLVLQPSGVKKMGELCLSVRFTSKSLTNMVRMYGSPNLPKMHHRDPLQILIEGLQFHAVQIVAFRLSQMDPPLRKEAVEYMCDVQSHLWSMRKSKVNFYRIMSALSIVITFWQRFLYVCSWENPAITLLVHAVFLLALMFHRFILPSTLLFTFFSIVWNYRHRPTHPSHVDIKISLTDTVHPDELDEEFDTFPTSRSSGLTMMRYDRLRCLASRIQTVMGDVASCGERITALTTWRDPTATAVFGLFTLAAAVIMCFTPWKILVAMVGLYIMRHPKLQRKMPSFVWNFYRRLSHKADSVL